MSAIMNALRKAGSRLNEFDTAYAARAAQDMGAIHEHPLRHMLGATPVMAKSEGYADSMIENLLLKGIDVGARASNLGYRYGLPAAGVTLAGQGLYDLTAQFGNEADYAQPGELPLS